MIRNDYLMRLIRQIAELAAKLLGLARQGNEQEMNRELDTAYQAYLGMSRANLDRLDPATAAMVLSQERCELLALLLEAEADCLEVLGNGARALERRTRASAVRNARGLAP